MKYAKIINKGECLSSINGKSSFNWKSIEIKEKAGRSEWDKHGFYPNNEMVGQVADTFENPLWGFNVFVLYIDDKYYVPMSESGIEFISEEEYNLKSNGSNNAGKSNKIKSLHEQEDLFHEKINKGGNNPLDYTTLEKRSIYKILLELAMADGRLDIGELFYTIQVKDLLNLSTSDIEEAKEMNSISTINIIQKMNDFKKITFKLMMIEMIGADGDTNDINENELFFGVCVACQI